MSAFSRTKGHTFERYVANLLKEIDPTAHRNVAECQQASVDIITKLPLSIQCKNLARWSMTPHAILQQAIDGGQEGTMPVGIVKITHKQPDLAIMKLSDFLDLIAFIFKEKEKPAEPKKPTVPFCYKAD